MPAAGLCSFPAAFFGLIREVFPRTNIQAAAAPILIARFATHRQILRTEMVEKLVSAALEKAATAAEINNGGDQYEDLVKSL